MICAVIFDLGDVFFRGMLELEHKITPLVGMPVEHTAFRIPERIDFFAGAISEETYWRAMILDNRWNVGIETLKRIARDHFTEIPGTRKIIEEVKLLGFKCGALSVHAREWIAYLEQTFPYHHLFDDVYYSCEEGILKPDPRAYKIIACRLRVAPDECVFADDTAKNVEAAEQLGMKGIVVISSEQLREELRRLEIPLLT